MEDLAAAIALISVAVALVALAAVVRPLPALKLGTRRRAWKVLGISLLGIVGAALIMPAPSPNKVSARPGRALTIAPASDTSTKIIASAPPRPIPTVAPTPPKANSIEVGAPIFSEPCRPEDALCAMSRKLIAKEYRAAFAGQYQAQRNLAFTFARGEFSPAKADRDPIQGCAWRLVIETTQLRSIDQTDMDNRRLDCSKLQPADLQAASIVAEKIADRITNRLGPPYP